MTNTETDTETDAPPAQESDGVLGNVTTYDCRTCGKSFLRDDQRNTHESVVHEEAHP